MATTPINRLVRDLLDACGRDGGTDGELLTSFLETRDAAAVEALVRRHGPMVWGVCRRLLRNRQDAEDAFQATFLVFAQKAAAVADRDAVGNWLYGVARLTAVRVRAAAAKRGARERQVADAPEPAAPGGGEWDDLGPVLDEELGGLPAMYRALVVLCDLQGVTRKDAARRLGIPEGTAASRLSTARALLAKRLARRGVAFSGALLGAALSHPSAAAGASPAVVTSTINAATVVAAGHSAAGAVSPAVAALKTGVIHAMFVTKMKGVIAAGLAAGLVLAGIGAGIGLSTDPPARGPETKSAKAPDAKTASVSVRIDGDKAVIVGGPGRAGDLVLRVGAAADRLAWTHAVKEAEAFEASVERSGAIRLAGGAVGPGFVFRLRNGAAGSDAFVHLPKAGAMPSGQLTFRREQDFVEQDGAVVFADLVAEGHKPVPVSVGVRPHEKPGEAQQPKGRPPLAGTDLSGAFFGGKGGITVRLTFGKGDAALWSVGDDSGTSHSDLKREDDAASGAVLLRAATVLKPRGFVVGRLERGADGGLALTILPAAGEIAAQYKPVAGIPLAPAK